MKKSFIFVSVLLTILLSSCSMLNKNSRKEVSVSIDTKPLANYARIFCDEVVKPEQEPESGSEDPLNSFIIKVNLSGDFRDEIEELKEVSFEKLIANPETLYFKFNNLEFTPGAKAKVKAEVLLNLADIEIPVTISNSLFSAEKEQTLAEGNNTFSLEMNYASPEWPTEGVLSYLPPLDGFWFYMEMKPEENMRCWAVYTKNKEMESEKINEYNEALQTQSEVFYDEMVKNEILEYCGYSDKYDFELSCSNFSDNNFTIAAYFYEAEPTEPITHEYTIPDAPEPDGDGITLNYKLVASDGFTFYANDPSFLSDLDFIAGIPSELLKVDEYIIEYTNLDTSEAGSTTGNKLSLTEGRYKISVNVNGKTEITSTIEEIEITETTQSIEFTFNQSETASDGQIALPLSFTADDGIKNYSISANGTCSIESKNINGNTTTWYSQAKSGYYYTSFIFNFKEENTKSAIDATVFVWPNLTTDMFMGPEGSVTEDNELIITPTYEMKLEDPVMS